MVLVIAACSSGTPKMSMEQCNKAMQKFNKKLPLGNKQSYIYASICHDGPIIHYLLKANTSAPKNQRNILVNMNCDTSRNLLEVIVGMRYTYYDESSGKKIAEYNLSIDDCN